MNTALKRALMLPIVVAGLSFSLLHAADWPQWRGPDRTDISKETGLLKTWPATGPKQLWVFKDAGFGYSGYSVAAGKLFTMGAKEDGEYLIAVDAVKGTQLWTAKMGSVLRNGWGDGPRGTPTVDGDRVYALGGDGTLVCVKVADGKEAWRTTMASLGGKVPGWGYTESVIVDGKNVICTPGGPQGALAAFDKVSGKVAWRSTDFTDGAQYASIIAINHNGARQLVQLTMKSLVGIDAATGKTLWKSEWPGQTAVIPTPIFADGSVYIASGYGVGCKLVKIGPGNAVSDVYMNKVMKNHHGGVVLVDGHLYGFSDGSGWVCQNLKTGDEVWAEKGKLGKGAISYADGMLYLLEENSGQVVLIEASSKGWSEKGRFKLDPQTLQRNPKGKIWTHPVIANGKLYLRDQELLHCYDVKGK
ncbi:MAG TPA: PQQ-binding-like beta-propeller repeat protein [Roseimicrobium sp.]|nr:PQQ-binding-like beta-propeller repeat protein [Roseimicrobium sp.]